MPEKGRKYANKKKKTCKRIFLYWEGANSKHHLNIDAMREERK